MTDFDLNKTVQELKEEIINIRSILQSGITDPTQLILDDVALRELMHVSKRKTQQWMDEGLITYSKPRSKIFYCMSDVLKMLENAKVPSSETALKNLLQKKAFNNRKKT